MSWVSDVPRSCSVVSNGSLSTGESDAMGEGTSPTGDIRDPVEWPLTAPQIGLWLDEEVASDPSLYNWGECLSLAGPLHLPQLRDAIQHVVDTTEALRLRIFVRGGIPGQQLAPHLPTELPVIDLDGCERPEEEALAW